MADPNIASITSLKLKADNYAFTTATGTITMNAAGSGLALEIVGFIITNIDGTASADATVTKVMADATSAAVVSTIPVAADSAEVIITKDAPIVLQEGDYLTGAASANGDLVANFAYREYA